jgi:hypothetical protein
MSSAPRSNVLTLHVLTFPAPSSPQNLTFSLHFPLHILKTQAADRSRSTTYAKCPEKLSNSWLTLAFSLQPLAFPSLAPHANVAATLVRFWTVSGPISLLLFTTPCSPTTCKTTSQNRSNSCLVAPACRAEASARRLEHPSEGESLGGARMHPEGHSTVTYGHLRSPTVTKFFF